MVWGFSYKSLFSFVPHWRRVFMIASFGPTQCSSCHHCKKGDGASAGDSLQGCLRCVFDPLLKTCFGFLRVQAPNSRKELLNLLVIMLRPPTSLGMKVTPVPEEKNSFQRELTAWRRLGRLFNLHPFLWPGLQIQSQSKATSTARSLSVICRCYLLAFFGFEAWPMNRALRDRPAIAAADARVEGVGFQRESNARGRSWASTRQDCEDTTCIFFGKIWSLMNLVWLIGSYHF